MKPSVAEQQAHLAWVRRSCDLWSLHAAVVRCIAWFGATASTLVMGVQPLTEHDVPDQLAHLEHHMHP